MKLSELKNNQSARVMQINVAHKTKTKLEKMGLTVGVKVTLIRRAPLGDPMELTLRGFNLAIRTDDANKITVEAI